MSTCGRCNQSVRVSETETCWYCGEPLCIECWDTYGHCGHEEADEINAKLRDAHEKSSTN